MSGAVREDRLLGGRVRLLQPVEGYRAATDPVLLAAAVAAEPGARVLDLGCGTGAASLCLAARVPGVALWGLERAPLHAGLAVRSAALNGVDLTVVEGDVAAMPAPLRALRFGHVMMNPPYFEAGRGGASASASREAANRESGAGLAVWIAAGLARLEDRGWLTVIQRVERLGEILGALEGRAGDVAMLPLAARAGRPAGRVIVQARKTARGPLRLLAPLVLHDGAAHLADRDDFTEAARAILRDAAPLRL